MEVDQQNKSESVETKDQQQTENQTQEEQKDASSATKSTTGTNDNQEKSSEHKPIVLLVLGMAGSGKTTFVHRLIAYMNEHGKRTYNLNLDPAVFEVNYPCNIDIRDSVKYKQVMKQYGLGPNGAILTSLNLFAAQFDQVIKLVESKQSQMDYIIVDTPGQIEAFSQSASGQIITQSFGCTFPTANIYIADTIRCENPNTFMSNMLYSLSILYKSKVPLLVAFNKTDILDHQFAVDWMTDFEAFDEALSKVDNYLASLSRSMSLVLDEFYQKVPSVGVSSSTGKGFQHLEGKFEELKQEYYEVFYPDLEAKQNQNQSNKEMSVQEFEESQKQQTKKDA